MAQVTELPASGYTEMPWRNGGGVTREYLVHPGADAFEWRVSVADVASDGPFSEFAGYERVLTLLSGAGMALTFSARADGETIGGVIAKLASRIG